MELSYLVRGAKVFAGDRFLKRDVLVKGGLIAEMEPEIQPFSGVSVFEMNNCFVFPGLIDVHVHLREPGFSFKETIRSGSLAAARGGFTTVCAMPNLNPVPDSVQNLHIELEMIKRDALIRVLPYGSVTVGQGQGALSDMDGMASEAVAFSDDGFGVQSGEMMEGAMRKAKSLGKMIVAHCEDESLLNGGYIHDGEYARLHSHKGISSESEWRQVERDIELVRKTGCDYHVCHVSTKESVELIRKAKAALLPVSCETAPHYLCLCDMDLKDEGRFRMNPPIRSAADRDALIEGIRDGTIEIIATDHAPHSEAEKSGGLRNSLNGIVGLETAFPILYTRLVRTGVISLEKLIGLMQVNPAKRFKIDSGIEVGKPADLTVFDLDEKYVIEPESFKSMGRSTPFAGEEVYGKCRLTMMNGRPTF
jgi:dihydroorotase